MRMKSVTSILSPQAIVSVRFGNPGIHAMEKE